MKEALDRLVALLGWHVVFLQQRGYHFIGSDTVRVDEFPDA